MLNNTVGLEFEIEKVSVGLTDGHFFCKVSSTYRG